MRGLRSTLLLIVVLAGLVGYIYYLDGRESTGTDTREELFSAVKEGDIESLNTVAGRSTRQPSRRIVRATCGSDVH